MINFPKKFKDANDEELIHWIENDNFDVTPLASDELTRRTLNELKKTIQNFNEESSRQTKKMVLLTWSVVILTIAMFLVLVIQVILALCI